MGQKPHAVRPRDCYEAWFQLAFQAATQLMSRFDGLGVGSVNNQGWQDDTQFKQRLQNALHDITALQTNSAPGAVPPGSTRRNNPSGPNPPAPPNLPLADEPQEQDANEDQDANENGNGPVRI